MSTAKEPTPEFTVEDFADILSATLQMAKELGLGVKLGAPQSGGLLIMVAGLTAVDGKIVVAQQEVEAIPQEGSQT